jgi:FAD/FMN-containing dehydrogenase
MAAAAVRLARNLRRTPAPDWLAELYSELGGKVRWDDVTLQIYSTAACFYEITPFAVVIPHSLEDLSAAIGVCARHKIPMLPRGAGSSLSGNAVGEAVILDLSHHFKEMTIIDDDRVRCGVGVVLNDLQNELRPHKRKFGPDPSSGNVCVIGGMLGNNSGGPHTIKHGSMVNHVEEVNLILANGRTLTARNILLRDIPMLENSQRYYY